ncbi:MAG: hypothetical protein ACM37Z_20165 [Deltaproteobacteria bacterium]
MIQLLTVLRRVGNLRGASPISMATYESLINSRPEVILDFTLAEGLLTIHLKNIGARSAYAVRTTFDRPFHGLGGKKCISEMRVFRNLEFMAPGKDLAQFIDVLANYAKRKQPMRIAATISYRDREGKRYEERIVHNLRIYLELGQAKIVRKREGG